MISLFISHRYGLHCAGNQSGCHGIGMKIYILKTQNNLVLTKKFEWTSEPHRDSVFHCSYRDIALNQLIEVNAKDIDLRVSIVECDADSKGRPILIAPEKVAANSDQSNAA